MNPSRLSRRAFISLGGMSLLSGCSALFQPPEQDTPTSPSSTQTASPTPTPEPTPTPTATPTPTPNLEDDPGSAISISNLEYTVEPSKYEYHTFVEGTFDVTNTTPKRLHKADIRIEVFYRPFIQTPGPHTVRASTAEQIGDKFIERQWQDGVEPDEFVEIEFKIWLPRDGRADKSTDKDEFELRFSVALVELAG